ncbi:MAG TPA: mannitol dehydrogenase family protein [Arachnia sp.]|nr:mannitol dehydrogenase family protein [Arachnia sp.]HMT86044.1 mannitol dehydrogenase family protein [Arachnia sp.]
MSIALSRAAGDGRPAAPVRIVHLGVGNFFRAHQAWYTDRASDADQWGIAAFTGRSAAIADALSPQGGLYTLLTRGADGDRADVISSLTAVHSANEHDAWLGYWASPALALVTLTVTEAGYLRDANGDIDLAHPRVAADVATLRQNPAAAVSTAPAKLVAGLLARRAAGAGPVALVPCDNLPGNGEALARVVTRLAEEVDPALPGWIDENVRFVSTMVDRITPATTDEHRAAAAQLTGRADAAPVPTEPFSEWIIEGSFPTGRPDWESAGARIVDDVAPFEHRKLAFLNGSHTLLAYAGSILGHETVDEAIADPRCLAWVEQWWDEAGAHVALPVEELTAYRAALLDRYRNPRIRHLLAQIAYDGSQKLPIRTLPTVRAERAAGRSAAGGARTIAAWVLHLRGLGAPVHDASADEALARISGPLADGIDGVLGLWGLEDDRALAAEVLAAAIELEALAAS